MMSVGLVQHAASTAAACITAEPSKPSCSYFSTLQLAASFRFCYVCADGHCESDFGQIDLKWYIRDPNSVTSAVWDTTQVCIKANPTASILARKQLSVSLAWIGIVLSFKLQSTGPQVVFLLYVSWTVPLRTCFGVDVHWPSFGFVADLCVDMYFFFDLISNFFTAYYDQNGNSSFGANHTC